MIIIFYVNKFPLTLLKTLPKSDESFQIFLFPSECFNKFAIDFLICLEYIIIVH